MKQRPWTESRFMHHEWGRFMGSFDTINFYTFSSNTVEHTIEERRHETRFENHITIISCMYYASYKIVDPSRPQIDGSEFAINHHLGTYDSRYHTMYIQESLAAHTYEQDSLYTPVLEYLSSFVIGANVVTVASISSVGKPPKGSKILENMCTDACTHHPEYKWQPRRQGVK